jgi:hypothetical protein
MRSAPVATWRDAPIGLAGTDPGPAVPAGEPAGGGARTAIQRHARLERAARVPELHDRP